MSLPAGVATCTVRIGSATTFTGDVVSIRATVEPSHNVVWAETMQALARIPAESSGDVGLTFTLPQDQDGFIDSGGNPIRGWSYTGRFELVGADGKSQHLRKRFTIPEGTADMDVLAVIDGTSADPVITPAAVVTSLDGLTGALTADQISEAQGAYLSWAADPSKLWTGTVTRDAGGAATAAAILWPDGITGTYTGTASATFAGAVDSYTLTHGTTTYTQPAVTRDANGNITNRPAITAA